MLEINSQAHLLDSVFISSSWLVSFEDYIVKPRSENTAIRNVESSVLNSIHLAKTMKIWSKKKRRIIILIIIFNHPLFVSSSDSINSIQDSSTLELSKRCFLFVKSVYSLLNIDLPSFRSFDFCFIYILFDLNYIPS